MGLTRIISGYFEVILFLSKALWHTPAPRTLRQEFGGQPRLYSKTVSQKQNKQKRVELILLNPITQNVEAERTIHLLLAYYCEHVPRKDETAGKGV